MSEQHLLALVQAECNRHLRGIEDELAPNHYEVDERERQQRAQQDKEDAWREMEELTGKSRKRAIR